VTLTDDAFDPVDELDRLDASLEHGEQRALFALMRRELTRHQGDIRRRPRKPLALSLVESRKDRDPTDLLRRHHVRHPRRQAVGAVEAREPHKRRIRSSKSSNSRS
jgi:hypothetical protein